MDVSVLFSSFLIALSPRAGIAMQISASSIERTSRKLCPVIVAISGYWEIGIFRLDLFLNNSLVVVAGARGELAEIVTRLVGLQKRKQ